MSLATCRECQGQVSTEAASCPHCGAPKPVAPEEQRPSPDARIDIGPPRKKRDGRFIAILVVGALIVVGIIAGSLSGPQTPAQVPPPQPERRTLSAMVGKDCAIIDMASMARDAGTAYEMAKAIAKDDRSNAVALLASGKITPIEGGGKARVIDSDWTNSALKVRMTSGRFLGREGWVYEGMCK